MCVVTLYKVENYEYLIIVYQTLYLQDDMETRKDIIKQFKGTNDISDFDEKRFVHGLIDSLSYKLDSYSESEHYYLFLESYQGRGK